MEQLTSALDNFLHAHPPLSVDEALGHELCDPECRDELWKIAQDTQDAFPLEKNLIHLFLYVRNLSKNLFHAAEGAAGCTQKLWNSTVKNSQKELYGGGAMNVIRAHYLEKAAVNMSLVHGPKYPSLEGDYAGKPFCAGGVSLISHPRNPYAPIMHMNIRSIVVDNNGKKTQWIGGGADLTPMMPFSEDTTFFHEFMQMACARNPRVGDYEKYKKWADEYFYIPHRKEMRGVGGIFFDYVPVESSHDFSFLLDVGQLAVHAYAQILSKRLILDYDEELHEKHLYWRARYAEFNLAYDRGTRFGLLSGGNHEAILCSMPPQVRW